MGKHLDFFGAATSLERLLMPQELRNTPPKPHTSSQDVLYLFDSHPQLSSIFTI